MWGHETSNDMYEAGMDNDQFFMIANSNKKCVVSVKTPWGGLCNKFTVHEVEMQGSVLTPLRCSLQVDTLGKQYMVDMEMNRQVHKYGNCISIPPMGMIDDVIAISNYGVNSVKVNDINSSNKPTPSFSFLATEFLRNIVALQSLPQIHDIDKILKQRETYSIFSNLAQFAVLIFAIIHLQFHYKVFTINNKSIF